jgi:hypothetical protein
VFFFPYPERLVLSLSKEVEGFVSPGGFLFEISNLQFSSPAQLLYRHKGDAGAFH